MHALIITILLCSLHAQRQIEVLLFCKSKGQFQLKRIQHFIRRLDPSFSNTTLPRALQHFNQSESILIEQMWSPQLYYDSKYYRELRTSYQLGSPRRQAFICRNEDPKSIDPSNRCPVVHEKSKLSNGLELHSAMIDPTVHQSMEIRPPSYQYSTLGPVSNQQFHTAFTF